MINNSDKYRALRAQYPVFEYVAYHHEVCGDGLRVWFDFRMGGVEFHPTALVERRPFLDMECADIDRLVFDIGMVELVSYWKCACPPTVRVLCGGLTEAQVAFWKKLYWNGLGEFYYTNGISEMPEAFMQFGVVGRADGTPQSSEFGTNDCVSQLRPPTFDLGTYLVPVGGGKDSVVTLELLRRAGKSIRPLIMNPRGATVECARVAGFPMDEALVIRRTIDPTLLELNKQGYLNGHTPFSAMLAFYTRLASVLSGVPNVALSNENSANESTVAGSYVNHQYSKSLEFEDDFRAYAPDFRYFSFLRPLSELQIAMLFSRFTQYHDVFRSCNVGSKQDIWCGHCAKCLFAYIILSPFIAPERLNQIFGKPLLDDLTLEHEFLQLIGEAETKPFECVGTVSEVRQALAMTIRRWYKTGRRPALIENIENIEHIINLENIENIEKNGNLTAEERQILTQAIKQSGNQAILSCSEKTN